MNKLSGFTLIELLVVIAILGILGTILIIVNPRPQARARDAKRIEEISRLSLALNLYYNHCNQQYPENLQDLVSPSEPACPPGTKAFIGGVPVDPGTGQAYLYGVKADYQEYHLGAILEESAHATLCSDSDFDSEAAGFINGFNGSGSGGICEESGQANGDKAESPIYDIHP